MSQSYQGTFGTLYIPSSVVDVKVETPNTGVATTGVLMLVGEAESGPDFSQEADITQNYFGADALATVIAKYRSGPIVDAFRIAASAANDPDLNGSPSRIYIAKTNTSIKASASLARSGFADYAVLADKSYGTAGNSINATVTAFKSEVAPSTGSFTYIPAHQGMSIGVRVNGGAKQGIAISGNTAPDALVGTVESTANTTFNSSVNASSVNNLLATGGLNRGVLAGGNVGANIALVATGNNVVISLASGSWTVSPLVGDTLIIPNAADYGLTVAGGSVLMSGAAGNRGSYVVTAVTSNSISATKLRDYGAATLTAPANKTAVAIASVNDLVCYSPVAVQNMSGTERLALTGLVGVTVTGTASGSSLTLTLGSGTWAVNPQVGDYMLMPVTAPAAWRASAVNSGWYQVTAVSSISGGATVTATRLSNGAPTSFASTAIAAVTDLRFFRPSVDGVGKSLEIFDNAGAESIAVSPYKFYNLSATQVSWISSSLVPYLFTSAAEYVAQMVVARNSDGISETLVGSGDVVLKVGYHGGGAATTATLTVSGTTLTTTVAGGNGSPLTIDLTQYKTLSDLASYINAQTGYSCAVASSLFGQLLLTYTDANGTVQTILDKGTYGICSQLGSLAGRIKRDGYDFFKEVADGSILVQLGTGKPVAASAGQPEAQSLFFLANGAKGATTAAKVTAAIDAMEKVRGNFLIPLFSRDATADYADRLTDVASDYQIDSINAYAKSHVLAMSTVKRKRNRQAFLSKKTSFTNAKLAANNLASARCSLNFQDFKFVDSTGSIKQFQPWAGAVAAAAMQAAGFYKAIFKKGINCSGVLMADGSYSDQLMSNVEDALQNGLLPAERAETGGFRWVSDQTTYAVDNNFVYNSVQAVYAADIIAQTIAQQMESAFIGKSVADVSSGVMLSHLQAVMGNLKRLKLTAASDGAPLGYRDAVVQINGPAAIVSIQVKLAGALYWIPVTAFITQVQNSAST